MGSKLTLSSKTFLTLNGETRHNVLAIRNGCPLIGRLPAGGKRRSERPE
jgi:hypothetical protein